MLSQDLDHAFVTTKQNIELPIASCFTLFLPLSPFIHLSRLDQKLGFYTQFFHSLQTSSKHGIPQIPPLSTSHPLPSPPSQIQLPILIPLSPSSLPFLFSPTPTTNISSFLLSTPKPTQPTIPAQNIQTNKSKIQTHLFLSSRYFSHQITQKHASAFFLRSSTL